jgi:hypothetical protein
LAKISALTDQSRLVFPTAALAQKPDVVNGLETDYEVLRHPRAQTADGRSRLIFPL